MKLFRLLGAVIWAIPFYYLWNYLAPIYLPQLPQPYLDVPFWHIAGIFMLIQIVKIMIFPSYRHRAMGHCSFKKYGKFGKQGFWTEKYRHQ